MLTRATLGVVALIAAGLAGGVAVLPPAERAGAATHAMALDADPLAGGVQASRSVSGTFEMALQATTVGSPYQGYQWKLAFPSGIAFEGSSNKTPNFDLCVPPGNSGATSAYGGCVSSTSSTSYVGELARMTLRCVNDGTYNIDLVSTSVEPGIGSSFLATGGAILDTSVAGVTVTCGGGGPGGGEGDCVVATVFSGERFSCADGRRVRMLQIEAQNIDECDGGWAKAALEFIFLIPGRRVTLVYDQTRTNGFGEHLAAPIWRAADGSEFNMSIVMVYVGLAKAADLNDGNRMFLDWARAAETWARVAQWNMWAPGKTYNGGC